MTVVTAVPIKATTDDREIGDDRHRSGLKRDELCRASPFFVGTLRVADKVLRELDEPVARAMGMMGEPCSVYLEIPTDMVREDGADALVLKQWSMTKPHRALPPPANLVADANAVSSDATKGLSCVPNFQPLTAWDDAEQAHREQG